MEARGRFCVKMAHWKPSARGAEPHLSPSEQASNKRQSSLFALSSSVLPSERPQSAVSSRLSAHPSAKVRSLKSEGGKAVRRAGEEWTNVIGRTSNIEP